MMSNRATPNYNGHVDYTFPSDAFFRPATVRAFFAVDSEGGVEVWEHLEIMAGCYNLLFTIPLSSLSDADEGKIRRLCEDNHPDTCDCRVCEDARSVADRL